MNATARHGGLAAGHRGPGRRARGASAPAPGSRTTAGSWTSSRAGKLAYVYLPNTGGGGYTYFNRYYFAQQDKQGAILDERFNGGGSAADYIVDVLAADC